MSYQAVSFSFQEIPSASKMNQLGQNDASFNDSTGINLQYNNLAGLSNPYKFHAYATATQNLLSSIQLVVFESEVFDTNNNYSTSTGKYTAPINGFYFFQAKDYVNNLADQQEAGIHLYKNGASVINQPAHASGTWDVRPQVSLLMQLTAGDYIQVAVSNTMGTRDHLGFTATGLTTSFFFAGFLVSKT